MVSTYYDFDAAGLLTTITDHADNQWNITRDSLGRERVVDDPDAGATTTVYDSLGRVLSSTDARGIVTTYSYDTHSRVTQVSYSNGEPTVFYTYDDPNVMFSLGRLTSMANGVATRSVTTYDPIGRIVGNRISVDEETRAFQYAYDGLDRPQIVIYPRRAHHFQ